MIGIGSPTFCLTPFPETLRAISKEFKLWEILNEGEDRLDLIKDEIRHGRDSYGMSYQVHAPLSDVNIGSVHEPMRQAALKEVMQTIALCHELEIPLVTVHPGFVQGIAFLDKRKAVEKTRESVVTLAEFAKNQSVQIVVENLPANINATCVTASELFEVLEGIDVKMCFDLGHANTSQQIDELLKSVDRFGNVHLHNNDGRWDQHNVINDGSADIRKVASVLKQSYHANIIIESTDLETGVESRAILEDLLS